MKRLIPKLLVLSALVIFLSKYLASSETKESDSSAIPFTELKVSNNFIELGEVELGDFSDLYFTLYNTGSEKLEIEDIEGDCFCTIPKWDSNSIYPRDSTIISVRINRTKRGIFQQQVLIHGNFVGSPKILRIRGTIL